MIYQLTKCLPTRSGSFNPRSRHDLARVRTGRAFRRLLHCSWNVSSAVCRDLSRHFPISRDPPTFFLFYSTRGSKGTEAREVGSDIDRHFLGLNLTSAVLRTGLVRSRSLTGLEDIATGYVGGSKTAVGQIPVRLVHHFQRELAP